MIEPIDLAYLEWGVYLPVGAAAIATVAQVSIDTIGALRRRKGPKNRC
jgi:hypothetical protein